MIRLLWSTDRKLDYDGEHFKLRDAVLGLRPPEEGPPPIWLAAHGKRMLGITGRLADGWLPMTIAVDVYRERLAQIRAAQQQAGRAEDAVTPGLWSYVVVAPTRAEAEQIVTHPLLRGLTFLMAAERFERYGSPHPLKHICYGLMDYVPTRVTAEDWFAGADLVPMELLNEFFIWGTPDDIVERTLQYVEAGCRHPVWWNVSFLTDLSRTGSSFHLLGEALHDLRKRLAKAVA